MSYPSTTSQWILESFTGPPGLRLQHDIPLPALGPNDVVLKVRAASLNSRDNQITLNKYVSEPVLPVVPLSDCAGTIIATGKSVKRFQVGSRCAATFHRKWLFGRLTSPSQTSKLGSDEDGVLRRYIILNEEDLVEIPSSLSFAEASTLPCAALTAWNALFCGSRPCKPGDAVLVQGSGGVSLFACQFARAVGATIIATTGELGGEREEKLKALGASKVLSYRDKDWGSQVRAATGGRGVDFIIEVSGSGDQDAKAIALNGQIAVIGGLGGGGSAIFDMRVTMAELRRIFTGSREQFEDMNRAIEVNKIGPIVDSKVWRFEDAREAFDHAASGKMWGEVVINMADD
ncbi:NAD(P)-binding protein [Mollisia scopiformis]|uniref:NAD(P)-binding protein n=1 Tax=Mollisia scopiformis TaxID=149040 RepID=A0A194XTC0_MOLSC|nr:NAD(P)-binding protein [Mollisia scopiformis]KUJ23453.1 NAD(P)-binding protein [Mollisia scopiformis]